MKHTLLFTALLLCVITLEIQTNPSNTSTALAPSNGDPFLWLIQRNNPKGANILGFYVNKTIYSFGQGPIFGIFVPSFKPTQLYYEIFDLLPVVQGKLDPNAFLVKVPSTVPPYLYLINPELGNKWKMQNITHTYLYGIDESKALIVNDEYLNRYPTQYVF